MEQLLFLLLLTMDMNKLFKFYWKKENQMLILQSRLFLIIILLFLFLFLFLFFYFLFSHFLIKRMEQLPFSMLRKMDMNKL